jgi:hypothetical protein
LGVRWIRPPVFRRTVARRTPGMLTVAPIPAYMQSHKLGS